MNAITDLPMDARGTGRISPFDPADEPPLRRFIERMIGEGFAMIVVRGERQNGLEEVTEWLHKECDRVCATLRSVNLGRFTFNNPWLELDHTIGKISRSENTILLLHGIDLRSELKHDDEVRLFRQLNVQRDSLTRDYPCFWVLYVPPRLDYQLKTQAPDFCDFVGYWCSIRPGEQSSPVPETRAPTTPTTPSLSAFGQEESLLEALGDRRLVSALTAIWDWKLDEARGLIAQYELSSHKLGRPGALEFVQGYLLYQQGDKAEAKRRFVSVQTHLESALNPRLRLELHAALGDLQKSVGELDAAMSSFRSANESAERLGDVREQAVTMGKIADILEQRGQTDEALRIRREEQLPVFEKLGDVRSKAVTMGQIADILKQRGQTDEALRIRREEELPVFEKFGDVWSKAVTMGRIADILEQRGQTDEALRIRREEQLPVFEKLGDVWLKAVTMGRIADILQQRGQTDEALRIRREEELPVYEKLGDVWSKAVTMGRIADILKQRGQTDEALRIRREEELPVFEKFGDVWSKAVTMGRIADILEQRGQTDEALRIRREEELPVYEKLGDVRSKAVTMGKIADILQQRGQTDEALRIRREEELPVYEKLGDVRGLIITRWQIGLELAKSRDQVQRKEGREHLRWALAEAEEQQYDFTAQLRKDVQRLHHQ